jgi:hypothetical protein
VEGPCEHDNEPSASRKCANSYVTERRVASQEGLSSMESGN